MKKALLASTVVLAFAGSAKADFTYNGYTIDPANVAVTITSPVNRTVLAGQITLDGAGSNAGQTLAAWCLDLIETLQQSFAYQESAVQAGVQFAGFPTGGLNATQIQEIGDLMLSGGLNNDKAATQVAIWALEYGPGFATIGFNDANVALDEAAVQFGGLLFNPNVTITALHDAITAPNQTLGFAAPVPGPAIGAGWPGAAFGALGLLWVRRRRQQFIR